MTEDKLIKDILDKDKNVDEETGVSKTNLIKQFLTLEINKEDEKSVKIPEQIAKKVGMTYRQMKEFILEKENKEELEPTWIIYKEVLKIKFYLQDKDVAKEMMNNYDLGTDGKSFPDIGFYIEDNETKLNIIKLMIHQTLLQREKNIKEAHTMGKQVISSEEEVELNKLLDSI